MKSTLVRIQAEVATSVDQLKDFFESSGNSKDLGSQTRLLIKLAAISEVTTKGLSDGSPIVCK